MHENKTCEANPLNRRRKTLFVKYVVMQVKILIRKTIRLP